MSAQHNRGQSMGINNSKGNEGSISTQNPNNCHNKVSNASSKGRTQHNFGASQSVYDDRYTAMGDHYTDLLSKNEGFFNHLQGHCICGTCTCGKCKCPRDMLIKDYKKGGVSEYQKQFLKKDNGSQRVDPSFYTMSYHQKQPMNLATTNRTDFDRKKGAPYKMHGPDKKSDRFLPFAGQSSYADQYVNYPNNPVASLKPPSHPTVIKDIPLEGKTSYGVNFKGDQVPYDPEIEYMINKNKRGQFKSPINPDFPFLDETTSKFYHQPYKTKKQNPFDNRRKYDPLPAFDGQYTSIKQGDYVPKDGNKCAARTTLENLPDGHRLRTFNGIK